MLRMPFSSVVVWSCTAARAHATSPKADSDVESHILPLFRSLPNPQNHTNLQIRKAEVRNAMQNRERKRKEMGGRG
jgi:hypothetical protein